VVVVLVVIVVAAVVVAASVTVVVVVVETSRLTSCLNFFIQCVAPTILPTALLSRHLVFRYFSEYSTIVE
jgi:hypothetical protein